MNDVESLLIRRNALQKRWFKTSRVRSEILYIDKAIVAYSETTLNDKIERVLEEARD
jgi:hypothetical protein